jgi:acetyl-CoA/propionyl-CoA carboxylase biotin carboxyl carrier protein
MGMHPNSQTVLVANRGEIACRIIRTLRRLGIRSVAVYSDADADAPHTRLADVAVRIGPAAARDSYLSVDAIMRAVAASGAEAVHPGYGFLSESTALAEACAAADVVFVGPPVAALELMGDKIRSKARVAESGVPVIPGTGAAGLDDDALVEAATGVGFPLIVKPSAGGGGKGMQIVDAPDGLREALAGARRVALAAFGDDELLLERVITVPRHIEVQVLADTHGTVVHLGERECSLQRRHQKVIEEAPSPLLDAATRARMGEAACEVARGAGYVGAGTVEFLVSDERPGEFFFMEMNARLQVEHPVTEEVVTIGGERLDLVEQQLRIANGEPLGFTQSDVALSGHAIEARLYAEDPASGFLPSTGTVLTYVPPSGTGIRVDSGIERSSRVTSDYDPMLAKVIAHGTDRGEALSRLDRALAETVVLGVHHNVAFLRALLAEPAVVAGELDTGVIGRMLPSHDFGTVEPAVLTAAAHALLDAGGARGGDPWRARDGWRLGKHHQATVIVEARGVRTKAVPDSGPATTSARVGDTVWIAHEGDAIAVRRISRDAALAERLAAIDRPSGAASPEVRSPMPGTVVAVTARTGDTVTAGQQLVTVEAMKMEHPLLAPADGIVTVRVSVGDLVRLDGVVATVEPAASTRSENEPTPAATSEPAAPSATSTGAQ